MPDRQPWMAPRAGGYSATPPAVDGPRPEPPTGPGSASEPLSEWHCPSRGHTTRARMADRDVPTPADYLSVGRYERDVEAVSRIVQARIAAEVAEEIAREIEARIPLDAILQARIVAENDAEIAREVGARYARNEQPRHPDGQRGERCNGNGAVMFDSDGWTVCPTCKGAGCPVTPPPA